MELLSKILCMEVLSTRHAGEPRIGVRGGLRHPENRAKAFDPGFRLSPE
jgi:hypothetical protein